MVRFDPVTAPTPLVLLVDDYEDSRFLYVHALRRSGFHVEEAEDGKEALEKAIALLPAIVVMDLSLPVMDGWEAIRRLRGDARTKHIPIVALTGHSLHAAEDNPGFDEVLIKPCLPEQLTARVRVLLAR